MLIIARRILERYSINLLIIFRILTHLCKFWAKLLELQTEPFSLWFYMPTLYRVMDETIIWNRHWDYLSKIYDLQVKKNKAHGGYGQM